MISSIRAEVRKLLSVRSTYVIMSIVLGLIIFFNFYIEGYWGQSGSSAGSLTPTAYREIIINTASIVALFISILTVVQIGHEYRYNTIMYTLTANARRTQVFLAKLLVYGLGSLLFALFAAGFALLCYHAGLALRGASLPVQEIDMFITLLRVMFYVTVYGLLGMMLGLLLRNIIGAVVVILMFSTTVEPLLGILLKNNAVYLPFATFDTTIGAALVQGNLTQNAAVVLSLVYMTVLSFVTWFLFLRRDAN